MDPVSIIGIVGTALSVAKVVTHAILKLSELKSRYHNVPLQLSTLIGQLYIVRAALEQISSWSSEDLFSSPRYQELAAQIDTSLDCFCPLILTLQQHLEELDLPQDLDMTVRSKVSFLWNEKDLMGYLGLLDCQVNALNLFLQAIQWCVINSSKYFYISNGLYSKTLVDQQNFINDEDSRTILQKAKECNTSIIGMSDGTSIFSEGTNIHTVSLEFDFDAVLLGSRAYRSAYRSNLKRVTTAARAPQSSSLSNAQQTLIPSLENRLEGSSWPLPPSVNETDESDQNAIQLGQTLIGNHRMDDDYPSRHRDLPIAAQQNTTVPAQSKNTANTTSSGPNLQIIRNIPPIVAGHRLTALSKAVVTPRSTLLSSLRNSWRTRTTKQTVFKMTEQEIAKVLAPPRYEIKLLILGSSESGKSTLLKGMKLYAEGEFTREDSVSFSGIIWTSIVKSIRVILEAMEDMEIPLQYERNKYHAETIFLQQLPFDDNFPPQLGIAIANLWADAGLKEAYRRRCDYQVQENVPYFASHIERLAVPGYMPSQEDIVRCRVKTTGITETTFEISHSGVCFRVFDVGGMRSERKKWIHTFENVASIAFTVDASAYCRLLLEDETVNRMQEQLDLWDSIANSRWFKRTSFVLIFTKIDWLPEQLKLYPVTTYFPDFKEPESSGMTLLIDSYLAYVKDRFVSLMQSEESRQRIRVMYTDLIHIGDHNPAGAVFEASRQLAYSLSKESLYNTISPR
jgi:guanine nucleotide-binding protein G(i) subunit alpha